MLPLRGVLRPEPMLKCRTRSGTDFPSGLAGAVDLDRVGGDLDLAVAFRSGALFGDLGDLEDLGDFGDLGELFPDFGGFPPSSSGPRFPAGVGSLVTISYVKVLGDCCSSRERPLRSEMDPPPIAGEAFSFSPEEVIPPPVWSEPSPNVAV